MNNNYAQFGSMYSYKTSFYEVIKLKGLTSGLQAVYDTGDGVSASNIHITWNDLVASQNFNLGTTTSAEATDPTFNGTNNGLSSNEYWSLDGGDYMTLGTGNPTWVTNMHKAGANWAFAGWVYLNSLASNQVIFATSSAGATVGLRLYVSTSGNIVVGLDRGSSPFTLTSGISGAATGGWNFIACHIDEANDSSTIAICNSTVANFAGNTSGFGAYTTPSAAAATSTIKLGCYGDNTNIIANGTRFGEFAFWSNTGGVVPFQPIGGTITGLMRALFMATRVRYGV